MMKKIALVPIQGTITRELSIFGGFPLSQLLKILDGLKSKKSIKAIILSMDSPGGELYPSKEIANKVKKLKKPTVAYIKGYATSGAYWIASVCDRVVADELAIVGGIGAAGIRPDFSGLLQKLGITIDSITSGKYKDFGWPFRKPDQEEKELIRDHVKAIYDSIFKSVKESRKLSPELLNEVREGKIFYGENALKAGLIDKLGDYEDCVQAAKELAGLKKAKIVDYSKKLRPRLLRGLLSF